MMGGQCPRALFYHLHRNQRPTDIALRATHNKQPPQLSALIRGTSGLEETSHRLAWNLDLRVFLFIMIIQHKERCIPSRLERRAKAFT